MTNMQLRKLRRQVAFYGVLSPYEEAWQCHSFIFWSMAV